jgi:hypothetical protein
MVRICCRRGSCARADPAKRVKRAKRVKSKARRISVEYRNRSGVRGMTTLIQFSIAISWLGSFV